MHGQLISTDSDLMAGFVIVRCRPERQHGILLLNASECEARIKYLPGFIAASFHLGIDGGCMAEYFQWRSPQDLMNALKVPAFSEHIPACDLASHETDAVMLRLHSVHTRTQTERTIRNDERAVLSCFKVYTSSATTVNDDTAELAEKSGRLLADLPHVSAVAVHRGLKGDCTAALIRFGKEADLDTVEAVRTFGLGMGCSGRVSEICRMEEVVVAAPPGGAPLRYRIETPGARAHSSDEQVARHFPG